MKWLRNLPIKQRLTFLILAICVVVLLLACAALAAYELFAFHRTLARDMTVLADILGRNTQAALKFEDEVAAGATLQTLQSEEHIVAAVLYRRDGTRLAEYIRSDATTDLPPQPAREGHRFEDGHILLFHPILLDGKPIGTIYLRADLQGIYQRLRLFGGIAGLVFLGSVLVVFALSSRLQRPISEPILALAKTAKVIAENKDYAVRAPPQGEDEVGTLTTAFNDMLAGIQERENALRNANEALREEVAERKRAEGRSQAQLARLDLLYRITRAIGERQDLQSIFQVVIGTLEENLPIDFSCVCLYDPAGNVLTVIRVGAKSEALAAELAMGEQAIVAIDENGLSRSVRGQLVYEPDVSRVAFPFPQRLARSGLRSLVVAPLLVESKVFGVLIAAGRQHDGFSSAECEFLRQLSGHVALAAHQAQLYTALQEAYDDLRQTQQAVMQQERLRALGQMASGIAHDINNAISPAALYTESLLEKEDGLSLRARDYLTTIQHAIDDVAQTVSRMREFYRQREPELMLVPLQVNRLIEQVIDLTRARWSDMPQQRGVVIELMKDLASDVPPIMGVESEIREALTNVIFNAVDAMPEGGTLTLRTSATEGPPTGGESVPRRSVQIEVIDTGGGMDEEARRRCLEPFFTTKGERGTGLGLAMVYGTMQRHNGDIEVDSAPGRGTTIRLIFPMPVRPVTEPAQAGAVLEMPPRMRLLVVDDDPLLIKSLRDTLEGDGHEVIAATGGQAGLDAFHAALERARPFGAVITDLGMPHVDGRKVANVVKSVAPDTPVILLTGWGQRLVAEGEVPPHVDVVLNKPPKLRELRAALVTARMRYH